MNLIKQTDLTNNFTVFHTLQTLEEQRDNLSRILNELERDQSNDIAKKKECGILLQKYNRAIENVNELNEALK